MCEEWRRIRAKTREARCKIVRPCVGWGFIPSVGFPDGSVVKNLAAIAFGPWVRKIPWKRKWQPTTVFLPEKFHGQRSLVGYSP